jgi:hypothetical protein
VVKRADGQRGELILSEVSRHHKEMVLVLTDLRKDDAVTRDRTRPQTSSGSTIDAAFGVWESEGGGGKDMSADQRLRRAAPRAGAWRSDGAR